MNVKQLFQLFPYLTFLFSALLAHIIFHPYLSGRQFRLELWSLLIMLVTLGISLYIPTFNVDGNNPEKIAAYVLSSVVLVLNVVVMLGSCSSSSPFDSLI